ncbi:hypothetical protein V500_02775 [Pseudogymnoascus sp. VKM F-4518 (FW-2643)]|nr:hypothetical protein V500_02775 [Pseudogymnoascus sp. VKM F-4518 (FW-2643)]
MAKCKAIGLHKEVVILEARQACSGATSRNGGHIKVPTYEVYCRNKKRYGKERAKAIVMFQLRHMPILAELEQKMNLEGAEVQEVETVDLFMDDVQFETSKGMVEELRNDFPELAEDIRVWEGDALRMKFEVGPHVNGAISYISGVISAYRFVSSLLASLLSTYQDLSLETGTPVQSISIIDSSWSFVQRKGFDYVVQRNLKGGEGGELMTGGGLFQSSKGMDELGLSSDDNTDPVIGAYLNGILPTVLGSENWGEDAPGGRLRDMWTGTMGYTADMQPLVGELDESLTGRSIKGHIASSIEQFGPSPAEWVSA